MNATEAILTNRFEQALVYATRLHAQQVRKGTGVPYISHLLSVTALVLEDGGDEDEAIAALLHDAVEDQGGVATREVILQQFGERVIQIVDGCTDTDVMPKPPWKERKQQHLENLRHASPAVCRVVLADKLHNARSILLDLRREGETVWQKFRGGKEGTLWYYRAALEVFEQLGYSLLLVEEFKRIVNELLYESIN
jgi:(p)ppGpp synthase/HD superfamily hydrolase